MENWISEIKEEGFERVSNEIVIKQQELEYLQSSVNNLQKKVNFLNSQKKKYGTKNSVWDDEIKQYEIFSEVNN